ncbi:B12-binding domain-containing radical SAM protein [Chloroflexota bacterium]
MASLIQISGYSFWSFKHALKFISKRADLPPLGLLTVATMLPQEWERKLVDMNVTTLTDEDLKWADYVFISAMVVHRDSVREIIERCKKFSTKIVAGGPLFFTEHKEFKAADHFALNEAEITLPPFLEDLEKGCARHIYKSDERPDMRKTPIPSWALIDMEKYSTMSIQYSRGCPFDCEFCDIVILNGRRPRTKDTDQILAELEAIYSQGWRSGVFIVDDNFIGNKIKLKAETLPAIIRWAEEKKYPFYFSTQASINLADDEELMQLMVKAGFNKVFIGIETLNDESLAECNKHQNENRDLVASIRKIQNYGLQVEGGFIVGFDNDPLSIFKSQISFIQRSGIVTAMVGLLQAPRGTRLYQRLKKENRLLKEISGDHMDYSINFIPKMNRETLINGYKNILNTIYSPNHYYERVRTLLREYKPRSKRRNRLQFCHVTGFLKSMWLLGIKEKERVYYWKLLLSTLLRHPRSVPLSISLAIYGFHFRKVVEEYNRTLLL